MTVYDHDGRIPEARVEPRTLAERIVRAGSIAKRRVRRVAWILRPVLGIALACAMMFALLVLGSSGRAIHDEPGLERMKMEIPELIERARRAEAERNRLYTQDLECRPPEYRPDALDAPAVTP